MSLNKISTYWVKEGLVPTPPTKEDFGNLETMAAQLGWYQMFKKNKKKPEEDGKPLWFYHQSSSQKHLIFVFASDTSLRYLTKQSFERWVSESHDAGS